MVEAQARRSAAVETGGVGAPGLQDRDDGSAIPSEPGAEFLPAERCSLLVQVRLPGRQSDLTSGSHRSEIPYQFIIPFNTYTQTTDADTKIRGRVSQLNTLIFVPISMSIGDQDNMVNIIR